MSPVPHPSVASIEAAVRVLRNGSLVAFPTETVYGLGADATNPLALRRIFAAKERPANHPLIVHHATTEKALAWARPSDPARRLAAKYWPGPMTLILPKAAHVPDEVTGGLQTIGLRVPRHPVAQELLRAFGGGVAAPSANRFGRLSPTTAAHVRSDLGPDILVLDGGPCPIGVESTIVDLTENGPAILRPGSVPAEAVIAEIGPLKTSSTAAPGTLAQHYSPHTALLLTEDVEREANRLRARGLRVEVLPALAPTDHARTLYAELRRLDALGVDVLVAQAAEETGLGAAINDRLRRASHPAALFDSKPLSRIGPSIESD